MDAMEDEDGLEDETLNGENDAGTNANINANIIVVDADESGANTNGLALSYDINQQIEIVYAFNLNDASRELALPALAKAHRSAIFNMSKKLGLTYTSTGPAAQTSPDDDLKQVVLSKPPTYVAKVWASPFAASKERRRGYDRIPVGPTEVVSGFLWLGSGRDADNVEHLRSLGVTHVLNVTSEWKEAAALAQHKVVVKRLPIKDFVTESISPHLENALAFIDAAREASGSRLLVHCVVGKSRSATVVLAYLMVRHGMTLHAAYHHVRNVREIRPNDGFFAEVTRLCLLLLLAANVWRQVAKLGEESSRADQP
jgi:predicted protein tyrosine phosphatase